MGAQFLGCLFIKFVTIRTIYKIARQKLDYTRYNSVEAGFVKRATDNRLC